MTWLPTYSFVHIALDFEHTGTPKKIFQIGACSRDGDCFKRDVNPECIISYETRMSTNTSLTDEYLATCPTWDIVAKEFIDWLVSKVKKNKLIFIGHGFANSELNCLKDGYKNYPSIVYPEFICTAQYIDTLDIAKKNKQLGKIPKDMQLQQGLIYTHLFGTTPNCAHDALDDAKTCMKIAEHDLFKNKFESVRKGGSLTFLRPVRFRVLSPT